MSAQTSNTLVVYALEVAATRGHWREIVRRPMRREVEEILRRRNEFKSLADERRRIVRITTEVVG